MCIERIKKGYANSTFEIVDKLDVENKCDEICRNYHEGLEDIINISGITNNPLKQPYQWEVTSTIGDCYKIVTCPECNNEFKVSDNDEREYGEYGCAFIECPRCGEKVWLEDEEGLYINEHNIEFPQHFSHSAVEEGAVEIGNEWINKEVKDILGRLRNSTDSNDFLYSAIGNAVVLGFKHDDGNIAIFVAKNYYSFDADYED